MKLTEKKRKNIVDAAVDEFRSHGFDGAGLTSIAKAAGVSSRTLYKHFPTKEALFEEIVEIIIAETGTISSEPFNPKEPVRDQLIRALEDYIAAATDDRYLGLIRILVTEFLRDLEHARRVYARAELHYNPVRAIIVGAIESGQIKDVDPQYATTLLSASAVSFFFWPKLLVGADSMDGSASIIPESVDMFLSKYEAKVES